MSDDNLLLKRNLENTNKALETIQENHKIAITKLKEKEFFISQLLNSGKFTKFWVLEYHEPSICLQTNLMHNLSIYKTENSLIDRAKELRINLQDASEDISALSTKLGT